MDTDLASENYATGRRTSGGFGVGLVSVPGIIFQRYQQFAIAKADLMRAILPLSSRLHVFVRGLFAIFTFVLFGASLCRAQGTYTAASCNQSDVNAVINGPTHTAVNGDKIIIPAGSCTWTSGITISGVGIDITGTGTPNTGAGTFGAGTSNTTLIDNASVALFAFTNLSYGETAKVELLTISAAGAANYASLGPISFSGTCTTSGCANVRGDNINFTANTWASPIADGAYFRTDNVFGVLDHNTISESSFPLGGAGPPLVNLSNSAWQGVGNYGDNSFASADTLGSAQQLYLENNSATGLRLDDNDVAPTGGDIGGARWACRFNQVFNMNGSGVCSAHGTSWGGRFRGQRQLEAYYNQINCTPSDACNVGFGVPSGTGYVFSNTYINSGSGSGFNASLQLSLYRTEGLGQSPWNNCDGTQPWDQTPWNSTSKCLDQPGTGAGLLLENATPVLASAPGTACSTSGQCYRNAALDPIYEAGDTGAHLNGIVIVSDTTRLAGHYYVEVSQSAQSSPTSPFNGTTGTGFGTLANRPTTCTTGVGYWATDQGTWNNGGAGGVLYICTATNTWSVGYTPYTYPHPLTAGGSTTSARPNPPTALAATVQ